MYQLFEIVLSTNNPYIIIRWKTKNNTQKQTNKMKQYFWNRVRIKAKNTFEFSSECRTIFFIGLSKLELMNRRRTREKRKPNAKKKNKKKIYEEINHKVRLETVRMYSRFGFVICWIFQFILKTNNKIVQIKPIHFRFASIYSWLIHGNYFSSVVSFNFRLIESHSQRARRSK